MGIHLLWLHLATGVDDPNEITLFRIVATTFGQNFFRD